MGLLKDEDKKFLKEKFKKILRHKANVTLFSSDKEDCMYCRDTEALINEVGELSDKIIVDILDIDDEDAKRRDILYAPTVVISDEDGEIDSRVRFLGIPSGYEFTAFIKDIMYVSTHQLEISNLIINELQNVKSNIKIEVFVTPTCPYCPKSVLIAHQFAMVSENIVAEGIESLEFQTLADKWNVSGVPHTVIKNLDKGNVVQFVGAYPENYVLNFVMEADAGKEINLF